MDEQYDLYQLLGLVHYREKRNVDITPANVMACDSAAFGIRVVCQTLLGPGDEAPMVRGFGGDNANLVTARVRARIPAQQPVGTGQGVGRPEAEQDHGQAEPLHGGAQHGAFFFRIAPTRRCVFVDEAAGHGAEGLEVGPMVGRKSGPIVGR